VRLMKLGALDLGTTVLSYISAEDPITEGVDLAGALVDAASARKAAQAYIPILSEHFNKKYDIKVLGLWPYPAQMLFCKSPVTNLDSLKGKKVRVSLRTTSDLIEAYGAITMTIPFDEVYKKLKDGSVDCLVTGTLPAHTAKFYEVTSHMYALPLGWSMMMAGVSQASWEKISPADQQTILAGAEKLSNDLWTASEKQTDLGIACNAGTTACSLENKGAIKVVAATDADKAKLREVVSKVVVKRWAERCGAACESQWYSTIGKIAGINK
jgi:TRAP-type C4-dicarboxylate transport system substrate-binding protein